MKSEQEKHEDGRMAINIAIEQIKDIGYLLGKGKIEEAKVCLMSLSEYLSQTLYRMKKKETQEPDVIKKDGGFSQLEKKY